MPDLAVRYQSQSRDDVMEVVRVERQLTAERINALVNDPHIRSWVAPGNEALDLTAQIERQGNVLLMGEHGGCMFLKLLPGVYEVHTVVDCGHRGKWDERTHQRLRLLDVSAHRLLRDTDARPKRAYCRQGGGRSAGHALRIYASEGMQFQGPADRCGHSFISDSGLAADGYRHDQGGAAIPQPTPCRRRGTGCRG